MSFAESKLGTLWAGFYNRQDFASEVATGRAQSFQRDAIVAGSLVVGELLLLANYKPPRKRQRRRQ